MLGKRRLIVATLVVGAFTLVLTAGTRAGPEGAVLRPVETTTTTSAPPATTTTTTTTTVPPPPVVPIGPADTEIATAVGTQVVVYEQIPIDPATDALGAATAADPVESADATVERMADLAAVPYSAERGGSPEIPSRQQAVEGRGRIDGGWVFDNPTPWGNPLTFAVGARQGHWVRVMLPVRPNGAQGWVRYEDVSLSVIHTGVRIDLDERMLWAFENGEVIAQTPIVVGASSTPTPTGRFFVTDYDPKYRGSAYGPWVLPLSGFSQAMDTFGGGVPVIAMHGTNRPDLLGGAHSNGCLRLPDDTIEALRQRLPLGTPVDIVA